MGAKPPKAKITNGNGAGRSSSVDPTGEFPFHVSDYVLHLVAAIDQFRVAALDHHMREFGLNVSRYRVLGVLNRFGACTMTELTNFTAMDRTTLTRIADHLIGDGLARRLADPKDRRVVLLEMTDRGRETHVKALQVVFDSNSRLLDGISEAKCRAAARVLRRVVHNLAPNENARDSIIHYSREALDEPKGGSAGAR